jgi:MSHA biogenesis protein MshI
MFGRKLSSQVGLTLTHDGMCLVACNNRTAEDPFGLSLCKYSSIDASTDPLAVLQQWVGAFDLNRACVTLTLEQDAFEVFQIDKPDVPEADLQSALHWKLQEYISYPLSDAISDVMPAPSDRHGRTSTMYVTAVRKELLEKRLEVIRAAGLEPVSIGIEQLALRDLLHHRLQALESVAALTIEQEVSRISIYDAQHYYFTRSIPMGSHMLLASNLSDRVELADQLALEVQRTMDYFDSYYGQAPVRKLYLLPQDTSLEWLTPELGSLIGLTCESILTSTERHSLDEAAALVPLAWGGLIGSMVS